MSIRTVAAEGIGAILIELKVAQITTRTQYIVALGTMPSWYPSQNDAVMMYMAPPSMLTVAPSGMQNIVLHHRGLGQ